MCRKITVEAGAYLLLALLLFLLPVQWIAAALTAGLIHELCHILAVRLCGGRILRIKISVCGAVIETEPMDNLRELICALAGPLGGLILLLFARQLPRVAVCAAIQSAYNLLPLYPLDGGRALRCGLLLLLPQKNAEHLLSFAQIACMCVILALTVYSALFLGLGLLPVLIVLILLRKIPCKLTRQRVQ